MKKVFRIVMLVLLGVVVLWTFYFLWQKSRPQVVVYEIIKVEQKTIEKKAVATGKVEPRNEIQIKPQIAGIIDELYKEAGEMVRKEEVIARIKLIPDMVTLNAAESRVKVAEVNLNQAQTDFDRQKGLYENKVISREEFEKSESGFILAKQEYQTAVDNLALTKEGITSKSGSQSNTLIRSTIDGMILNIPVKVGNSVIQSNNFNEGTTIATVADMSDMLFVGKVDETEVGQIKEQMPIKLTIGALNDRNFDAKLEYISPKGTEESGAILFEIKAAAKISENIFVRAGYSANAEIVLQSVKDVLSIPESSVEFNGDTAFVYVLTSEEPQQFEKRSIQIGLSDGIYIEVKEGLDADSQLRGAVIDPKAKQPAL